MKLSPHTETVTTTVEEVTGVAVVLPLELVLYLRNIGGCGSMRKIEEHLSDKVQDSYPGYAVTVEQREQFGDLLLSILELCGDASGGYGGCGFPFHSQEWGVDKLRAHLKKVKGL